MSIQYTEESLIPITAQMSQKFFKRSQWESYRGITKTNRKRLLLPKALLHSKAGGLQERKLL